jgi:hypothetical protein
MKKENEDVLKEVVDAMVDLQITFRSMLKRFDKIENKLGKIWRLERKCSLPEDMDLEKMDLEKKED